MRGGQGSEPATRTDRDSETESTPVLESNHGQADTYASIPLRTRTVSASVLGHNNRPSTYQQSRGHSEGRWEVCWTGNTEIVTR